MRRDRCILAVDTPDASSARALLDATAPWFDWYKIGLQLYLAEGASVCAPFRDAGKKIFLDLKLHDIPHTVRSAAASLKPLAPDLLTVHASGGRDMIEAAVQGLDGQGQILAVTVLTSLSSNDTARIFEATPASLAARWLAEAKAGGAWGFVCSPEEVTQLKKQWPGGNAVTPGIRFADSSRDDQSRIATPASALQAGSDMLVLGRAITAAPDIEAAVAKLDQDLAPLSS